MTRVLPWLKDKRAILIVIALLLLIALVGSVTNEDFRTVRNLTNVVEQSVPLGLIALGQTLVILTGGIDLSIGGLMNLCSLLASGTINGQSDRLIPVIIGILALGAAVGAISGILITTLRVHPVIVTLGMGTICQGATLMYSLSPVGSMPPGFDWLAWGRVAGIPVGAIMLVILFVIVGLFLRRARLGRYIYAVGGNAESARLSGISSRKVLIFAYSACGFFAALGAIYIVSRLGGGDPWTARGYELNSITPVVVGGTMLTGGVGGVFGTLIGVFLISSLNNMLNFMDISSFYQWIVQGFIIIVSVSFYAKRGRR